MKNAEPSENEILGLSMQFRELGQCYRKLIRANRSACLVELTASLAHELNQPLAAILSNAQAGLRFLASGKNDPDIFREILQNIVRDDKRASNVIRGLRSMLRGEPTKAPVNLNDLINDVLVIIESELIERDIIVETRCDETPLSVIADKTQIQQVLLNLIMNAADAMAQIPHHRRRIILRTEKCDGFVHVAVRDFGTGIPVEAAGRVFEPFYTTKSDGLGMGLAVCRSIITHNGGHIWAENNHGGGATFSFALHMRNGDW